MAESAMVASELPLEAILNFIRVSPDYVSEADEALIGLAHNAALEHICESLALTIEEVDKHPNLAIACLVLIRDMYDNRTPYVDRSCAPNRTVESIFALYDCNLL